MLLQILRQQNGEATSVFFIEGRNRFVKAVNMNYSVVGRVGVPRQGNLNPVQFDPSRSGRCVD